MRKILGYHISTTFSIFTKRGCLFRRVVSAKFALRDNGWWGSQAWSDKRKILCRVHLIPCFSSFESNTIQYSVPSMAEIDMTSSGSGYGRHLTNSLTIIKKRRKKNKANKANKSNVNTLCTMTSSCLALACASSGGLNLWKKDCTGKAWAMPWLTKSSLKT